MFEVWNDTDGIPAAPHLFATEDEANKFIKEFRERFAEQGFYLNSSMQRIPLDELVLVTIHKADGGNGLATPTRRLPREGRKVANGEWRAFYDYGAALNWIEDTTNTNFYNKMSMVKESDMDAWPDLEWPFESAMLIIWLGNAEGPFLGRPTQVELIDIAAAEHGLYNGKTKS